MSEPPGAEPHEADPDDLAAIRAALAADAAWIERLAEAQQAGDRDALHQLAGLPTTPADPTGAGAPR